MTNLETAELQAIDVRREKIRVGSSSLGVPGDGEERESVDRGDTGRLLSLAREGTTRRLQNVIESLDRPPPFTLEWKNICAEVSETDSTDTKQILFDVCGAVNPGELLAIMGPSGAGKSSLLTILAGRFDGESTSGDILFNGQTRAKQMKRHVAFVLQTDVMFGELTVRETLTITARLRLPETVLVDEQIKRVSAIIELMGLDKCADTLVNFISGGERKRLSIANEILVNPSVLLLDEPTSGLDSTTAFSILRTLQELVNNGRTIACAIHQPSSQLFAKFDKLALLADGRVVYFGPARDAVSYMSRLGYEPPTNWNAADFLLELITEDFTSDELDMTNKKEVKKRLQGIWDKDHPRDDEESPGSSPQSKDTTPETDVIVSGSKWNSSWWTQFKILAYRAFKVKRGQNVKKNTLIEYVGISVITGLLWFQMKPTEENINDFVSSNFFIHTYLGFSVMFKAIATFPLEKSIVTKERQSGAYRLSAYFFGKSFAEIPVEVALPLVALTILYWMTGLHASFAIFLGYVGISILGLFSSSSFGLFLGCFFMDFEASLTFLAVIGIFFMLFGGFLIKDRAIPPWLVFFRFLSGFRYSYLGTIRLIMRDTNFSCAQNTSQKQTAFKQCLPGGKGYITGDEVLADSGITETLPQTIMILLIQIVVWRSVAYFFLRLRTQKTVQKPFCLDNIC